MENCWRPWESRAGIWPCWCSLSTSTPTPLRPSTRRYQLIWFQCPLLFYWISHVWLIAHRGKMPDDPVVFAVSDRTSLILALLMLAVTLVAL